MEIRKTMNPLELSTLKVAWPGGREEEIGVGDNIVPGILKQANSKGYFSWTDPEDYDEYEGTIISMGYFRDFSGKDWNEWEDKFDGGGAAITYQQFLDLGSPFFLEEVRTYTSLGKD